MSKHEHSHIFNPEKAGKLLDPKRKQLLPPDDILNLFQLKQGDVAADLGAGNGFFTIPMAKRTGETVYAVDIEPKMLDGLKEHAEREGVNNIKFIVGSLAETSLQEQSISKLFSSFVMHEVPDLDAALDEIKLIITEEGMGLILDWEAVESESGPPVHIRIPSDKLEQKFVEHGFKTQLTKINEAVYALIISK